MAKDSAYTSTRQVPAAYTCEDLGPVYRDGHNLDYGGGRFDDATRYLMDKHSCKNSVYDPYNRSPEHNQEVMDYVAKPAAHGNDPVTSLSVLNVLNVLKSAAERRDMLKAAMALASGSSHIQAIVIQVYEGDRSGKPSRSPRTQLNKPASFYKDEIVRSAPYGWHLSPKMYGDKRNIYLLTRKEGLVMAATKASAVKKKTAAPKTSAAPKKRESFNELQIKRELATQLDRMCSLANPCGMTVTSCQVFLLKEPMGKTKALARVVMNDCLQLTGLRVLDGVTGLFVAYPNDPNYKGEDYRSLFYPITKELRVHIEQQVLLKYQEAIDSGKAVV